MARARNIKPSFFINEDLVELSFETRLLFIGLWTLCDREGYLEDKPKKIKMAIFPADDVNVDRMLNDLQSCGFLIRYVAANRKCIYLPKFAKHQNPHHKECVNDVPRYTLGKPEANLGQEQGKHQEDAFFAENNQFENQLNSIGYADDGINLGQALGKPESNRADILIPDSLNLNPDYGNLKDETIDPRFNLSLSEVNTKLKFGGLNPISQEELTPLLVKLHSAYSHKKQMVKNQVLGKAFEWVERQQRTPLLTQKQNTQYQTSAQKTASEHDRWRQAEQRILGGGERDVTPKKTLLIEEVSHA